MARNIYANLAQLLHQPPYLGAADVKIFRDLGPANHDRCVRRQQPNQPAETGVGLCAGQTQVRPSAWERLIDAGIMS